MTAAKNQAQRLFDENFRLRETRGAVMPDLQNIRNRMTAQCAWLVDNAPNVTVEQKHLDEGSTERAYWHYGYMVALRDVLKLLETTH